MQRLGALYLINPDGHVRAVDEGIEHANGLALSPDSRTLYFSDSTARRIYQYRVHPVTGDLSDKRVFANVPADDGLPDGLAVDNDGFLWCALWYGAQVIRYDADGKVERRIAMPVLQVSSLAFGGADLTELYVTSAAEAWPSAYAPSGFNPKSSNMGGQLFRISPGVQGRAEHVARISRA
jgi:D-xylonolactonase